MAGRGRRRSARTEVGALERASADAAERKAVTLRKLWRAVVGTRPAGGVNATMESMNYRDREGGSCSGGEFMRSSTWSHEVNRNSRKAERASSQNARRELKKVRTR